MINEYPFHSLLSPQRIALVMFYCYYHYYQFALLQPGFSYRQSYSFLPFLIKASLATFLKTKETRTSSTTMEAPNKAS